MPLFLYSDQLDADMSRTTVLMPQAVYDQHFRQFLAAVTGVDRLRSRRAGAAGSLDYDAYGGTLFIELCGDDWDVENLAGSRVVWNTPVPGLRAAGHVRTATGTRRARSTTRQPRAIRMAGIVPADWDGR